MVDSRYLLSHPQKRIYFAELAHPYTPMHNVCGFTLQPASINKDFLLASVQTFVQRHEGIRLRLELNESKEVMQYISPIPESPAALEEVDFSGESDPWEAFQQWAREQARIPQALLGQSLYSFTFVKIHDGLQGLFMKFHHILSDGWSIALTREIWETYAAHLEGKICTPEEQLPAPSYIGYLDREKQYLDSPRCGEDRQFWLERLNNLPEALWPLHQEEPFADCIEYVELEEGLSQHIRERASEAGASLNDYFIAAAFLYLHRLTQRKDIVLCTPVLNRSGRKEKQAFGMYISTMPVRIRLDGVQSWSELLDSVRNELRACFFHQKYPLDKLAQDIGSNPKVIDQILQVCVNYNNSSLANEYTREVFNGCSPHSLHMLVNEWSEAGRIGIEFRYSSKDHTTKMVQHFITLLEAVAGDPLIGLADAELLTAADKRQLLYGFNDTALDYPGSKTIHQLFEEQAERTPDRPALVFGGRSVTYRQLNGQANRLAGLLREQGVKPDTIVGIMTDRSPEMIAGLYAILKAGGAYLPIDPGYPAERIRYLLEDSGAELLLVQPHLRERTGFEGLKLDLDWQEGGELPAANLQPVNRSDDLAYVIYTSGSTGKPKGVMIEHRSVLNFIHGMLEKLPVSDCRSILTVTTLSFDIFVLETLLPLSAGLCVILANEAEATDSRLLDPLVNACQADLLQTTPSRMALLLGGGETSWLRQLRVILLGGEPLPPRLLERLKRETGARLFNMYGPTETTVWSALEEVTAASQITIGRPIANTSLLILNADRQLQPAGVAGEICIAGDGLARGYWRRPELTAEKFVEHPYAPGRRMYRTGDLARWLPDGRVEHLGRMDDQMKIRGFRIEAGEVEEALLSHEAVKEAAVAVHRNDEGEEMLCAYFVTAADSFGAEGDSREALTYDLWRSYLSTRLPYYMIPSSFTQLAQMPLTPNGKTDRKALPAPVQTARKTAFAGPRNEEEAVLTEVWERVLSQTGIGIYDHFFESGGSSLKFAQVAVQLSRRGFHVSMEDMFQYQTIEQLARHVSRMKERKRDEEAESARVPLHPNIAYSLSYPTESGKRLWGDCKLVRYPYRLEPEWVRQALRILLERHDALRLRSTLAEEGWIQTVERCGELLPFELVEMACVSEEERLELTLQKVRAAENRIYLDGELPIRLVLFDYGAGASSELACCIHHFCYDQVSLETFMNDFCQLLRQHREGCPLLLPPAGSSYKEFADAMQQYTESEACLKQFTYWRQLTDQEGFEIPLDYPEEQCVVWSPRYHMDRIDMKETMKWLDGYTRQHHLQLHDLLLAAFMRSYRKWSGQDKLVMNLFDTGRYPYAPDLELSGTMGWIASKYPVRFSIDASHSALESLFAIAEQKRQVPKDNSYGLLRYCHSDAGIRAEMAEIPEPQVNFNFLGQAAEKKQDEAGEIEVVDLPKREEQQENRLIGNYLSVGSSLDGETLNVGWYYVDKLHEVGTIERLAELFRDELSEATLAMQAGSTLTRR